MMIQALRHEPVATLMGPGVAFGDRATAGITAAGQREGQ
jgi:hypothetical protein